MRIKKFPNETKSGLGITKSGRLQVPYMWSPSVEQEAQGVNCYGQPIAKIGDYIAAVAHGGRITKKNIGVLVDTKYLEGWRDYIVMKHLDGEIKEGGWLDGVYVLSEAQYNDAINYLTKE